MREDGGVHRVVVAGCAGSGKSVLARRLAGQTGLPLVERDALGAMGSGQYRAALSRLAGEQRWILDGAPYYLNDLIYPAADTVVFLDYPKLVVVWRVWRRTLGVELFRRPAGAHRPQGRAAWRDGTHPVRWAWRSHRDRHYEGLALLTRSDLVNAQIIRFTRPADARRWLRRI